MTTWSTERLEASLGRQLSWISAAESRIALIIPLSTALFGSIALKYSSFSQTPCWIQASHWLTLSLLSASIICASIAIFPRTRGPKSSQIFFGGIASQSSDGFIEAIDETSEDSYRKDLAEQVYINAKIAVVKFTWIRRSGIAP